MQGTDVNKFIQQIKDIVTECTEKEMDKFCLYLLQQAILGRKTGGGHNVTGNLINSLVVLLYKKGRFVSGYFAHEDLKKPPLRVKMTAGKKYYIKPTWDGGSFAGKVGVDTNEGWGMDDAIDFASSYKSNPSNLFEVVVACPVEYAGFIAHDTGLIRADWAAKIVIMSYFKGSGHYMYETISY